MKRKTPYGGFVPYKRPLKKRRIYNPRPRSFVPRTMGPFANTENKYFDQYVSATAIAEGTSWANTTLDPTTFNSLGTVQQGDDIGQRTGRRIEIYKIAIRGVIETAALTDQADVIASPAVRLIFVQDKQTNGVQLDGTDVMAAPSTATVPLTFCTFRSLATLGRFVIHKDIILRPRIVTVGTDGASTLSENVSQMPFKMNIKFRKPVQQHYADANSTVASMVDHSFHLLGTKSGTGFAHTISYQTRVYFKDY